MLLVPILVAALALAGLAFFLRRPRAAGPAAALPRQDVSAGPAPAAAASAPAPKPAAVLAELDGLDWIRAETLPEARRQAIGSVFRHVPRPPRLLHQLISPEFANNASLDELAELIGREPLVASKVLATANSPMFGLSSPVTGLSQAISTLGLLTLRTLCLRYTMIRSFKADTPERERLLGNLWNASALASELCGKLAQAIGRPDPGRLVTLVVLSYLGRLAATATMPRGLLATIPVGSFLERTRNEQASLGLGSAEIGGLLMREWDLPESLVDDVRRVDRCLVKANDPDLALCYLAARLGEQLASGELHSLADFDLLHSDSADFHRIQERLGRPGWQALAGALREPELVEAMRAMAQSLRDGAGAA